MVRVTSGSRGRGNLQFWFWRFSLFICSRTCILKDEEFKVVRPALLPEVVSERRFIKSPSSAGGLRTHSIGNEWKIRSQEAL